MALSLASRGRFACPFPGSPCPSHVANLHALFETVGGDAPLRRPNASVEQQPAQRGTQLLGSLDNPVGPARRRSRGALVEDCKAELGGGGVREGTHVPHRRLALGLVPCAEDDREAPLRKKYGGLSADAIRGAGDGNARAIRQGIRGRHQLGERIAAQSALPDAPQQAFALAVGRKRQPLCSREEAAQRGLERKDSRRQQQDADGGHGGQPGVFAEVTSR
eukprot:scaffold28_cov101-Isochrysis_galbana.AAC.1